MNIPAIQCEVTPDEKQVTFRCGYCNRRHYHGNEAGTHEKGHRVSHCHINPNPYPNGYILRTDLDAVYCKQYSNLAVIPSTEKARNRHFYKCRDLGLPCVAILRYRNYAHIDVDFVTVEFVMSGEINRRIHQAGLDYRLKCKAYQKPGKRKLGCIGILSNKACVAGFWIYINDVHSIASMLMPSINDKKLWVPL